MKLKWIYKTIFLSLLIGCLVSCKNTKKSTPQSSTTKTAADSFQLPKPDHIVIVIEENHSYDDVIGSKLAPYINKLAKEGAVFTDSHGVTHPSQPNYIALFSGSVQGVKGDECLSDTSFTTPNLGAALINAGYTFGGYSQTLPDTRFLGCYYAKSKLNGSPLYGRKHCPWVNWIGDGSHQLSKAINHKMMEFPADFNTLPTVSFVIPDMDHDMHNDSDNPKMITKADTWLKKNVGAYIEWAKTHNSLFILTFDEDDFTVKNRIPTLFVGQMVNPGKYADSINHYNVLSTLEHMYGLARTGAAKTARPITKVWKK